MKKLINILLIISLLSVYTDSYWVFAEKADDIRVFYHDDFETGYEENLKEVNLDGKSLGSKKGLIERAVNDNGDYVLRITTPEDGGYNTLSFTKNLIIEDKPKIVLEYKLKANLIGGSAYLGFVTASGVPTCFIRGNSVMADSYNGEEICDVDIKDWTTITIVYDNEGANRTIYVNGKNCGTYDGSTFNEGETYSQTGVLNIALSATIQQNTVVEYDYIKVYEFPSEYSNETFEPLLYKNIGAVQKTFVDGDMFDKQPDYIVLKELGIYIEDDLGIYDENSPMTRLNFALLLSKTLNISANADLKGLYKDVPIRHFAIGKLETLNEMGIMQGIEKGGFGPNEPITYQQAIAVLVRALGYEEIALNTGGYPIGYLSTAAKIGFKKESSISDNDILNQKNALEIFMRFIESEIFGISSVRNSGYSKQALEGNTVLKAYHRIDILEDIVTTNRFTSLDKPNGITKDNIKVGNTILKVDDPKIHNMLGLKLKIYYNMDTNTVIYYETHNINNITCINIDNFIRYDGGKIFYNESNRITNEIIPIDADIIYNNKAADLDNTLFEGLDTGNITLIDNNGDGNYDIVIIKNYINCVIDKKSPLNGFMCFKYNKGSVSLNSDFDEYEIYSIDGKKMTFEMLKENTVLSMLVSKNDVLAVIYASSNIKSGTITEIGKINEREYIILDDTETIFTGRNFLHDNNYLTVGARGDFCLDIFGYAVGFILETDNKEGFAYLLNAVKKGNFDNIIMVKMFTEYNSIDIFYSNKKISFDGKYIDSIDALALLCDSEDNVINQMIKYKTNETGFLISIDTQTYNIEEDPENTLNLFFSGELKYNAASKSFGGNLYLHNDCKIFVLPDDNVKLSEEDEFQIINQKNLDNDVDYNVLAYKTSESDLGACVLVLNKSASETYYSYSHVYIISKITETLNEKMETVNGVYYYYEGKEHVAYTKKKTMFEGVCAGDAVLMKIDSNGLIYACKLLFDMDKPTENGVNTISNRKAAHRNSYGYVYYLKSDLYQLSTKDPNTTAELVLETHRLPNYIYLYNSRNKMVEIGSANDIVDYISDKEIYSKVFVYETKGYDYDMVIYN